MVAPELDSPGHAARSGPQREHAGPGQGQPLLPLSHCKNYRDGYAAGMPVTRNVRQIVIAGDWHGNGGWARTVIGRAGELLAGEDFRLVVQLGDFGIWTGRQSDLYLQALSDALDANGVTLWFIDGNHECFPKISAYRERSGARPDQLAPMDARGLIWHIPRGYRWEWHGRRWLAVGGGVSLDKASRVEDIEWWPQEDVTPEQAAAIAAAGPADVMLCHDIPTDVMTPLRPQLGNPPHWWASEDFEREAACQVQLQVIADAARPSVMFHGHMHRPYRRAVTMKHGIVAVHGLDADGDDANWGLLDVTTMQWIPVKPTPVLTGRPTPRS